jgi:hypothetical protein
VILAAAALKGFRLRRQGLPAKQRPAFIAGTAASFASTLASQALIRLVERDSSLAPYAAYRAGLAGVVLARLGLSRRRRRAASEERLRQLALEVPSAPDARGNGGGPAEGVRGAGETTG